MIRATPLARCRRALRIAVPLTLGALAGCEREHRNFQSAPPGASEESAVRTSALHAGPAAPEPSAGAYQENRWAVGEGQRLYEWYNCAGCHSPGGGGGIGPALSDAEWIYGSDPENIFDAIIKGRPHGMPSYRGRIGNAETWRLVAYVRSLSGLTPLDSWPARSDHMAESVPEERDMGPGAPPDSTRVPPEQRAPERRP